MRPWIFTAVPATDEGKQSATERVGAMLMDLVRRDVRPRQIVTREALENAIASVASTGGSTNAVLHLLAIAREAGVPLNMEDFDRISQRTPVLADLKPGGRFMAADMFHAGGAPLLAQRLHQLGLLKSDALTVTGKTIGEEAAQARETPGQEVIRPLGPSAEGQWRTGHFERQPRPRGLRDESGWPRRPAISAGRRGYSTAKKSPLPPFSQA